jgi:hypothetical protein
VGQGVAVIRTSNPADLYPKFNKIEIADQPYTPDQPVVITSDSAKVKAEISSPYSISKNMVAILVDRKAADFLSFSNIKPFGDQYNILSLSVETVLKNLSSGNHALSLVAGNELGFTTQNIALTVATAHLVGMPLVFPSPFNPSSGSNLTIQYSLSQDADIDIFIFGSSIAIIKKITTYKGLEGGRLGANKVVWDGRTDFGTIVSNGIYVGTLVDRNSQTVLGKMKLVIY